jgi:Co/Zn/Cd efflux system component
VVSQTARLWVVLAANLGLVVALVGVGIAAHSLRVFAEGADYLADAAAIGVSLLAIYLSSRPLSEAVRDDGVLLSNQVERNAFEVYKRLTAR